MPEVLAWFAGAAAGLAGILYVARMIWKGFRYLEAINDLVGHELKPNSGGSLYDKVTRTDRALTEHLKEAANDRDRLAVIERHLGLN